MSYGIIAGVSVLVISIAVGILAKINVKDQVALSSLMTGSAFGVSAGFMIGEALGLAALSIVFLLFAFLFGYERG